MNCVSVCWCVWCRVWLLATKTLFSPKFLHANVFVFNFFGGFQILSFRVSREIWEHLLNDPELWRYVGCWCVGELEQRSLHGTSLGPGLLSWSHIKEQPCLSTCAGWSPFAFPSVGKVSHIRTYTKCKDRRRGEREDEEKVERMHLSLEPQSLEQPPIRVEARLTAMEYDNQRI